MESEIVSSDLASKPYCRTDDGGAVGGIVGTYSFLEKDAPLYRNGYIIGLSFACFSGAMATIYFLGLLYENRQRERMLAEGVEVTAEEEEKLGDLACTYRYAY